MCCNPLQRVASRVYCVESRAKCAGPEFVVKAALPPRELFLAASKHRVTVVLLDGQRLEVSCNPSSTSAEALLRRVLAQERTEDSFLFGLSALIGGDFVFVPEDTRLSKVLTAPGCLYVRVRFYLPTLRGLRHPHTRHLLYLQLRRSLLEHQLPSSFSQIVELAGLALQAELGDGPPCFLLEHYVPETVLSVQEERQLQQQLAAAHARLRGLPCADAEDQFIQRAQALPHYGGHFYSALWAQKEAWLYIHAHGISLLERGRAVSHAPPRQYHAFTWRDIHTLRYSRRDLTVVAGRKFKVQLAHKKSYYAFRLASLHHQFFLGLRRQVSLQALGRRFGAPEERQNAQNWLQEPRRGVKMGTRVFAPPRPKSPSLHSEGEAFVLDATLTPHDLLPNLEETINATFQERMEALSFAEERVLSRVRLTRDSVDGSLGLQVTEGSDGNVYITGVTYSQFTNVLMFKFV